MINIDMHNITEDVNNFIQRAADFIGIPFNEVGREWETYVVHHNAEFKNSDIVLEFGAWPRYVSLYTAQFVNSIIVSDSFDWSDNRANEFDSFLTKNDWISRVQSGIRNGRCEQLDITNTKYSDKKFDKIISYSVLEHIPNDVKAINEICRILKDDGIVSMTVDMKYGRAIPYDHKTRGGAYNRQSLEALIKGSGLKFDGDHFPSWWQESSLPDSQIFPLAVKLIKR